MLTSKDASMALLFAAIEADNVGELKKILTEDSSLLVQKFGPHGNTPLLQALEHEKPNCVRYLLTEIKNNPALTIVNLANHSPFHMLMMVGKNDQLLNDFEKYLQYLIVNAPLTKSTLNESVGIRTEQLRSPLALAYEYCKEDRLTEKLAICKRNGINVYFSARPHWYHLPGNDFKKNLMRYEETLKLAEVKEAAEDLYKVFEQKNALEYAIEMMDVEMVEYCLKNMDLKRLKPDLSLWLLKNLHQDISKENKDKLLTIARMLAKKGIDLQPLKQEITKIDANKPPWLTGKQGSLQYLADLKSTIDALTSTPDIKQQPLTPGSTTQAEVSMSMENFNTARSFFESGALTDKDVINVFLIGARNAILLDPGKFCDFKIAGDRIIAGYKDSASPSLATDWVVGQLAALKPNEIAHAETQLANIVNTGNDPNLNPDQLDMLRQLSIAREVGSVKTVVTHKGTGAKEVEQIIQREIKERTAVLTAASFAEGGSASTTKSTTKDTETKESREATEKEKKVLAERIKSLKPPLGYDPRKEETELGKNLNFPLSRERPREEWVDARAEALRAATGESENKEVKRNRELRLTTRDIKRVNPYKYLALPSSPITLPYDPIAGNEVNEKPETRGIVSINLAVSFPPGTISDLHPGVLELIRKYKIDINKFEKFFVVQDMPWRGGVPILFIPHTWLHQNAPADVGTGQPAPWSAKAKTWSGLADIHSAFHELAPVEATTHADSPGDILHFSPANKYILGPNNQQLDTNATHAFYALCFDPATGRGAQILFWLVNDQDHDQIVPILEKAKTLQDFFNLISTEKGLQNSVLNKPGFSGLTPLQDALRLAGDRAALALDAGYAVDALSDYRLQEQIVLDAQAKRGPKRKNLLPIILKNDVNQLQIALASKEYDVDAAIHPNGETALMRTASEGNLMAVMILIMAGAKREKTDQNQHDALWFAQQVHPEAAVNQRRQAVAQALREMSNPLTNTPLIWAAIHNRVDVLIELNRFIAATTSDLEQRKKIIDTPNSQGVTALLWGTYHGSFESVMVLIEAGGNPSQRNMAGRDAFALANERNHTALLAALNAMRDPLRNTPLVWAAINNRADVLGHLIHLIAATTQTPDQRKRRISAPNSQGATPLLWGAHHGSFESVMLLIEAGGDPEQRNSAGADAYDNAQRAGHTPLLSALNELRARRNTPLAWAYAHRIEKPDLVTLLEKEELTFTNVPAAPKK